MVRCSTRLDPGQLPPSSHLPACLETHTYGNMSRSIAGYGPQSAQYCSRPFRGPSGEPQVTRCFRLGWPLHLSSRGRYLRPASLATGRPWLCRHPHPGARCSDSTIGLRFIDLDEFFFCAASIAPVHVSYGLLGLYSSTYVPSPWHDRSSAYDITGSSLDADLPIL
ncbi:hypothetical protein V8C44DRAFT_204453 [Trichoderma aethiopicum]